MNSPALSPWDRRFQIIRISTDASPWGIGGILFVGSRPVEYFADIIQTDDLKNFNAKRGESAFTTLWEALAALVALRVWIGHIGEGTSVELRSDSLGALSAISKGSSRATNVNKVMGELALMEAFTGAKITMLTHIPGVSNEWPDALSRLAGPERKYVPAQLSSVHRAQRGHEA